MDYILTDSYNCIEITLSNFTYFKVLLGADTIAEFKCSGLVSKIFNVGNLNPATYTLETDGSIDNIDSFNKSIDSIGDLAFKIGYLCKSSEEQSATRSDTYVDKVNYVTPSLPKGSYRIAYYSEARTSNNKSKYNIRLLIDDVEYLMSSGDDTGSNGWKSDKGFSYINFDQEDTHNIKLQFKTENGSKTVYIRRAKVEIWRIS